MSMFPNFPSDEDYLETAVKLLQPINLNSTIWRFCMAFKRIFPDFGFLCLQHLRSLRAYFHRGGISDESLETDLFQRVQDALQLNCLTTEELMLQYYHNLAEQMVLANPSHCLERCLQLISWIVYPREAKLSATS